MPWKPSDASKHNKGLTSKQKRQWANVANSVLSACQAKGGSDCEGKAVRAANSTIKSK